MSEINYPKIPVNKFMGVYKEVKDDKNFTHYVITSDIDKQINEYVINLKEKIEKLELEHSENIKNLKNEYSKKIEVLNSKNKAFLEKLKNDNLTLEDINLELKNNLNDYKKLNDNLLRIARERANQKRGLFPKKAHNGFIILNRKSTFYKFTSKKGNKTDVFEFDCFKIVIQTPFDSSISLDLIERDIINSFKDFIINLNISNWYNYLAIKDYSVNEIINLFNEAEGNFIFKESFIANSKTNLWELEIYTKNDIVFNN